MIISLNDIKIFSKCPRYYQFAKKTRKSLESRRAKIFRTTLQKCYSYQKDGYKPTWRTLMGWVDTQVFKDVNVTSDTAINKGRAISESILLPLRSWYNEVFLNEHIDSYVNLPIEYNSGGFQFTTTIPILKMVDPIKVSILSDIEYSQLQLYNDILSRGTGLLVSRKLEQQPIIVEHILLGQISSLDIKKIECDDELNARTEKALLQIAKQIKDKVDYPSYTSMCNTCAFRHDCIL